MAVLTVTFDEVKFAWEIMRGVLEGRMEAPDPKQVQFQDPKTKETLSIKDIPWTRVMTAWVQQLPKPIVAQTGARVLALVNLCMSHSEAFSSGFLPQTGQIHEAMLKTAAICPLHPTNGFDLGEFHRVYEAERRVMDLVL